MHLDQLIKSCIKKDRRAQEELYNLYSAKLFPVCLKYFRSHAQAEDHLHDVFIEVFNKINTYKGKGSFEGWMKRIAINKAIDRYKKNKDVPLRESKAINLSEDTKLFETEVSTSLQTLMSYIQELPNQYKIVFNLYELDDYSHKDISKMLGISEGTSKSNLHRAKTLLKTKILNNKNKGALKTNDHGK